MKLNLGAGDCLHPGFMNIGLEDKNHPDWMPWDLRRGLPPNVSNVEEIRSTHFFEHLRDSDGQDLMRECLDKMVTGGLFRMALPNFKSMVKAYLDNDFEFFNVLPLQQFSSVPGQIRLIDVCTYGVYQYETNTSGAIEAEHKSLWDAEKACAVLQHIGFRDVCEVPYDGSIEPPSELRRRYTFVVQGRK